MRVGNNLYVRLNCIFFKPLCKAMIRLQLFRGQCPVSSPNKCWWHLYIARTGRHVGAQPARLQPLQAPCPGGTSLLQTALRAWGLPGAQSSTSALPDAQSILPNCSFEQASSSKEDEEGEILWHAFRAALEWLCCCCELSTKGSLFVQGMKIPNSSC